MILETLVGAAIVLSKPVEVVCPIRGEAIPENAKFVDYNGIRFSVCCPGCDTAFEKNPGATIAAFRKKGWVSGKSLFDPVTGSRVYETKAKGSSDYKGIRFYFQTAANKATFDKTPAKFGELATKEVMTCAISKEKIGGYANACGYYDINAVRYYLCCAGCIEPFKKDPAKAIASVSKLISAPKVSNPGKNEGGHPEEIHGKP